MQMKSIHEYDVESNPYSDGVTSDRYCLNPLTPNMSSFKPDNKDEEHENEKVNNNNNTNSSHGNVEDDHGQNDKEDGASNQDDDDEQIRTENKKPVLECDDIELKEDHGGIQNEGFGSNNDDENVTEQVKKEDSEMKN